MVKLETTIETERPHLATKDDVSQVRVAVERQTRLLVMWFIATQIAIALFLYTALTGAPA